MQKFETNNIRFKIGLIFIFFLIVLKLFTLSDSIKRNSQLKQFGTIINDSYLYYDTETDIIVTGIMLIFFILSIIKLKNWKPRYLFITEEGLKFTIPKKDEVVIPFSDLKSIRFYSSKIVTTKGTVRFPIMDIKNLSNFLILLKSKLDEDFSAKQMKLIDNRII